MTGKYFVLALCLVAAMTGVSARRSKKPKIKNYQALLASIKSDTQLAELLSVDEIFDYHSTFHHGGEHEEKTLDELMHGAGDEMPDVDADDDDDGKDPAKRIALTKKNKLWPAGVIPFKLDEEIENDPDEKSVIFEGMKEWMTKTCLSFPRWSSELGDKLGLRQHIKIRGDRDGCWSYIGRQRKLGAQTVSIDRYGCMFSETVMHELGHAIGLHHEQNRPDRDDFVDVLYEKIEKSEYPQFKKAGKNSQDEITGYDYLSIMQYGPRSFGINDAITMKTKNECYMNLIGLVKHISFNDHKLINHLYGCVNGCDSSTCGPDCYASRTTVNEGDCECLCEDKSADPCKNPPTPAPNPWYWWVRK